MELIACEACGNLVSDEALSCPRCGQPFVDSEDNIITTQRTLKRWKLLKAMSWVFIIIFGWFFLNGLAEGNELRIWVGFSMAFIFIIVLIISKIGSWWSTG